MLNHQKIETMSPSGITYGLALEMPAQYTLGLGFHAVLFLVFHLGSFSFIEAMEKEIINL